MSTIVARVDARGIMADQRSRIKDWKTADVMLAATVIIVDSRAVSSPIGRIRKAAKMGGSDQYHRPAIRATDTRRQTQWRRYIGIVPTLFP